MAESNIRIAQRLRSLRADVRKLNATLVGDLKPFLNDRLSDLFRRLPNSASRPDDANVTTSCTDLMALCSNEQFDTFFKIQAKPQELHERRRERVITILQKLTDAEWRSSGLPTDNAFTTILILRTAGFLAHNHDPVSIRNRRKNLAL